MEKLKEIFCMNICLTSRKFIIFVIGVLISGAVIASILSEEEVVIKIKDKEEPTEIWVPTAEDIQYQDSMFQIIQQTQFEVDTIKIHINDILQKIEELDR